FPVPGGPQRITDESRSDSTSTRSGLPGPSSSSWPTMSSSRWGRSRAASGAWRARCSSAAALNRSPPGADERAIGARLPIRHPLRPGAAGCARGRSRENGRVTDLRRSPRLSRDEVALVLRRAAELDAAAGGPPPDGYEPAAVEEAAREVGLSPAAVRQAVAELRAGVLPAEGTGRRRAATSRVVGEQRLVATPPEAALAHIDRF